MNKTVSAIVLFFLSSYSVAYSHDSLTGRVNAHRQAVQTWVKAVKNTAIRSDDPEAIYLSNWMIQRKVAGMPDGDGAADLEPLKPDRLLLIPLLPGDEKQGGEWSDIMAQHTLAEANVVLSVIYIKSRNFTEVDQGIIGLHELYHVCYQKMDAAAIPDAGTLAKAKIELPAWELEFRIIRKIGGQAYADLLARRKAWIIAEMAKNNQQLGRWIPWGGPYYPELSSIFGPPLSQKEREYRMVKLTEAAYFSLLEEEYNGDIKLKKAQVIQAIGRLSHTTDK